MKFRNPKTGEVFTDKGEKFCGEHFPDCHGCPIWKARIGQYISCRTWVRLNPKLSAILMGYELLEGEQTAISSVTIKLNPEPMGSGGVGGEPAKSFSESCQEYREQQDDSLHLTECPERGSKDIEREPGTRHWTCHECGRESEPDRTAKADGGEVAFPHNPDMAGSGGV